MRMRSLLFTLFLTALLGLALVAGAAAQNKAAKPPKPSNIQGKVQMLSKDKSMITVATSTVPREVVYDSDTKFMYGHSKDNKPGSLDQVKEGYFISCQGTFPQGKTQLNAKVCVYRETK